MNRMSLIFLSTLLSQSILQAQASSLNVNLNEEYQTIENFSASDCWSFQKIGGWSEPAKERIADLLFSTDKGIGLSAWRFNIGAGINRATIQHSWRTVETFEVSEGVYDWDRQAEERWFLQAAKARGVDQFIAFVNSPPGRITRNGRTNCTDGMGSTNLKPGSEGQYATYLADILKHFRDEWAIDFDYISPVNEPQWEWNNGCNQEGNRAGNDDIKRIVAALYDELQRQGLDTQISLVESGDLKSWYLNNSGMTSKYGQNYGNYLNDLFNDPDIKSKIGRHLCGHSYWSDRIANQLTQHRQVLYPKLRPYLLNDWTYWVTEYCILDGPEGQGGNGRDLTMKTALDVARVIHYDLTMLQASAWQWWTAVSPENYKDGLIYTNSSNSQTIILSKLLWTFGNYSRFIRPGFVRVNLAGADDKYGLLGSAYRSADGKTLIIVLLNMGRSAETIDLVVESTNKETNYRFIPYVTSDNEQDNLKPYTPFTSDTSYVVPGRAAVTLVCSLQASIESEYGDHYSPKECHILPNFPNPFSHSTVFDYYLPAAGSVTLSIYTVNGRLIKTIVDRHQNGGLYRNIWDGSDERNKIVSNGVYILSLKTDGYFDSRKIVFIR
ncbi:T9SS type A sorting domain-containing protein [candidate division KSB1 bacterium]|nr:T9SS type A sorting domain-containing protein [candidate division KSB1 bacterium]